MHNRLAFLAAIGAATAVVAPAQGQQPADLLVTNGHVYAGRTEGSDTAVAIRGGVIVAVDSDAGVRRFRGPKTTMVDANGGWILPGLEDDHVHLLMGATSLSQPDVRQAVDLPAIQRIVREAAQQQRLGWVQAGGWALTQLPSGGPTKEMLDAVVADRPIVLWSLDRHAAWANSKALALAGITKAMPDPAMGEIVRDAAGEPTGWLKEASAVALVTQAIPLPTPAEHRALMRLAMAEANRQGITALTHAALGGSPAEFDLLKEMDRAGELTTRITYAFGVDPGCTEQKFRAYQAIWKSSPASPRLKTGVVKFFLDGVPQAHTAFLLSPWGPQPEDGHPLMAPAEFRHWAQAFDAAGWQLMMHAMGDGAVRMALDEVKALNATKAPARGRRHRVEHAYLIDPADMPRFGALNVVANFQPINVFPLPLSYINSKGSGVPQDGRRWAGLDAMGAHVSFGSDWPVFPMDPWGRIYAVAAGRRDQRMDPLAIIDDYTRGTAYATFDEKRLGTLERGKLADIVVLKSYLGHRIPASRDDLQVATTIFDGRIVYRAGAHDMPK